MQGSYADAALDELRNLITMQQEQINRLQRRRIFSRWLGIVVAAVVSLSVASGVYASIPDSSGTIHGCIMAHVGFLRVIDDATQHCSPAETPISWSQGGTSGGVNGFQVYRPGRSSFTVPAGITHLFVEAWGAGGGGSAADPKAGRGGAGGGSGAYFYGVVTVSPLQSYTINVGWGGAAGSGGSPAGDGSDTSIVSQGDGTVVMDARGGAGSSGTQSPGVGRQVTPLAGLSLNGRIGSVAPSPCSPRPCGSETYGRGGFTAYRTNILIDPSKPNPVLGEGGTGGAYAPVVPPFTSAAQPGGDGLLLMQW